MNWRAGVFLAAVAAVLLSGCTGTSPFKEGALTVVFTDAAPIVPGNYVRASGVQVGLVEAVTLKDGLAHVSVEFDDRIQLHEDATAIITANNLLGEKFIQLDSGSPDKPLLPRPYVIDEEQSRSLVDILEVIDSVDDPTGKALGLMLTALGDGVDGQGEQAAAAIERLGPSMMQVQNLSRVLDGQNALLNRLIDNLTPVASAARGARGADLDKLVDTTIKTLGIVAAEREATAATLRELPSTLAQARERLAQLAGVSAPTTETLRSLRPATDQLVDISAELRRFSEAGDPALASLQPVLERGTEMLREARPFVSDIRPGGEALRGVSSAGREAAEHALGERLTDLMEFMKGWSLATSDYDAVSHYFKAIFPQSPSPTGRGLAGPVAPLPEDPLGGAPAPTPPRPPLPGRSGGDSSAGQDSATERGAEYPSSPTGLTPEQEGSMLDQMLGDK